MRPSEALNLHREAIRLIVSQNTGKNPRIFGSVLTQEDTEDSDLDILIDSTKKTTLFKIAEIESRIEKLLQVRVDVLTPQDLPLSFRNKVLSEALPI